MGFGPVLHNFAFVVVGILLYFLGLISSLPGHVRFVFDENFSNAFAR